jgi:hypothetical protein
MGAELGMCVGGGGGGDAGLLEPVRSSRAMTFTTWVRMEAANKRSAR